MDRATRMEIAQRVKEFLLRRHPDLMAVWIEGSTAKAEDQEHSDLEMTAVTRGANDTKAYQAIWEGIVVEVGVTSAEDAIRDAARVDWAWPMWADSYAGAAPLYDPEALLPQLARTASNPDPGKIPGAVRHAYISMYEDLCKLRNFAKSGEDRLFRLMSMGFALYGLARFVALLNRQHFNGIRNLLTKPREFALLPPHFWEDYPRLIAADGTVGDLLGAAERMHDECGHLLQGAGYALPRVESLEAALEAGRHGKR